MRPDVCTYLGLDLCIKKLGVFGDNTWYWSLIVVERYS